MSILRGRPVPHTVTRGTTGMFTCPAGSYAVVKAQVRSGGSFRVSGSQVLSSVDSTWSTLSSCNVQTVVDGHGNRGYVSSGGSAVSPTTAFSASTARDQTESTGEFTLRPGDTCQGSGTAFYCAEIYSI